MNIVSIHQPSYFPWLGLLDKIAKTNTFILLDDVQVEKGSYQYRNIFYCEGKAKFITLPINYKLGVTFKELTFNSNINNWKKDHFNKLFNYYYKSPFFKQVIKDLEDFFSLNFKTPLEVLWKSFLFALDKLQIKVKIYFSSEFNVDEKKALKVLELCKKVNANIYIAGQGSKNYLIDYLNKFEENGIKVKWHNFVHPIYEQNPKYNFLNGLSCLDIFFFQGYEKSREIFWRNICNE